MGEAVSQQRSGSLGPRILCVEDEVLFMRILRRGMARQPVGDVIEARLARDAFQLIADGGWDALITDINLEGEGVGLEVARRARAKKPDAPIMVLSAFLEKDAVEAAGAVGALCLPKRELYPALTTFVAGVVAGWAAQPENASRVADALIDAEIVDAVDGAAGGLTAREVERVRIEARHSGDAEAHARMGLTERSFRNYGSSVRAKIGISISELGRRVLRSALERWPKYLFKNDK